MNEHHSQIYSIFSKPVVILFTAKGEPHPNPRKGSLKLFYNCFYRSRILAFIRIFLITAKVHGETTSYHQSTPIASCYYHHSYRQPHIDVRLEYPMAERVYNSCSYKSQIFLEAAMYLPWAVDFSLTAEFRKLMKSMTTYSLQGGIARGIASILCRNMSDTSRFSIYLHIDTPGVLSTTLPDYAPGYEYITLGNSSFSFYSCVSLQDGGLSFWGYGNPFQAEVWIATDLFWVAICFVLLAQNWEAVQKKVSYSSFFMLLDVSSTFVEQFPSSLGKLGPSSSRLLLVHVFGFIVLVNAYKSIVTNDTTAPLTPKPVLSFDQLIPNHIKIVGSSINQMQQNIIMGPGLGIVNRVGMGSFDD